MAAAAAGLVLLALGLTLLRGQNVAKMTGVVAIVAALLLAGVRGDAPLSAEDTTRAGTVSWSREALNSLRASGTPVFVDVTADWCITCLANEQAVLFTDEMTEAFAEAGVTYMVADWTNYDAEIADFIAKHGRTGIPLYLLYPANPAEEPLLLPQLLTKSIVLEALQTVSPKKTEVAAQLPDVN